MFNVESEKLLHFGIITGKHIVIEMKLFHIIPAQNTIITVSH